MTHCWAGPDRGNDLIVTGQGFDQVIGGYGNDTIIATSIDGDEMFYSAGTRTDQYLREYDFTEFFDTGFSDTNYDLPGGIAVTAGRAAGVQHVSKYLTSVSVGDRFGEDRLEDFRVLVGTDGSDYLEVAADLSQSIYGGYGDDTLKGGTGTSVGRLYGGQGDDRFSSGNDNADFMYGGEGSDIFVIAGDAGVDGDAIFGDDNRSVRLEGDDILDFSQSDFAWHVYLNPLSGNGTATSKYAISAADAEDPRFIQPTQRIDGVVAKLPGVVVPGEVYPGTPFELRVPDANTEEPGGRTTALGEIEIILGSNLRDIITVGDPETPITVYGNGGDDVLFSGQQNNDSLYGGVGNDVLGTFNPSFSTDPEGNYYNRGLVALLDGGEGDDLFVAGNFRENFVGGAGIDELTFETSIAINGVTVNLATGQMAGGSAEGDSATGIENLTGSQFGDRLTGDDGVNLILGWAGSDIIRGGGGNDALYGGEGADQLFGEAGNDLLHGGNNPTNLGDTLDGGEGNERYS